MKAVFVLSLLLLKTSWAALEVKSDSYLRLSADKKMERIWHNIKEDTSSAHYLNLLKLSGIFLIPMCRTFRSQGDEMPYEWFIGYRQKYIHRVGSVGKVEWRSRGNHPYTGIFKGSTKGLVRLSFANEPRGNQTVPGMGLKFLRNGRDSANLVAMNSLQGQESWNFFQQDLTTIFQKQYVLSRILK